MTTKSYPERIQDILTKAGNPVIPTKHREFVEEPRVQMSNDTFLKFLGIHMARAAHGPTAEMSVRS